MKNTAKNNSGVALLLVMGVMAILSFILFEFTFETKLNKLKIYNQEDRFQARLNAEAGLNFALAKLRLYQEGRNLIEKNESMKSSFPSSDLESVIIQPFMIPIPVSAKASIIQTNALKDFEKNLMFKGEMSVTITKLSGLLNPNALRIVDKKTPDDKNNNENIIQNQNQDQNQDQDSEKDNKPMNPNGTDKPKVNRWETVQKLFLKTISQLVTDKLKSDEEFHKKHANTSPEQLINELAFYVNDENKVLGQNFGEAKVKFEQANLAIKHGPMASLEELHLLPSWDDSMVELLKNQMSIHELTSIPINEINSSDLKVIFPEITDIQVEEFFKYRDGDPDKKIKPMKFKSAEDFKNVVTGHLNILSDKEYQTRIQELKDAGLVIDTAGKLYRISSKGVFNNANYTIIATVDLPVKEPIQDPNKNPNQTPNPNGQSSTIVTPSAEQTGAPPKDPPVELLQPRVVEIRVE